MRVTLDTFTNQPVTVCAVAARTCYSYELPETIEMTYTDAVKLLSRTIKSGHHSVLEHASFTFHISGISRVCTHQLVRHRMASFSQQSQRYVTMHTDYVFPGCFRNLDHEKDEQMFEASLRYEEAMDRAWDYYRQLIEMGVPEEDARYVLPNACKTNIVVTMNARELFHFFELRMCNRAQQEIRDMARMMYDECMRVAPDIFKFSGPRCWFDGCIEDHPCGCPPKVI
jgi:thymidylate synthase (FAD)